MPKDLLKTFEFASFSQVFDYNIKTFKKKNSPSKHKWTIIHNGLTISGTCKNS